MDLGPIDPQVDILSFGVGEQALQGAELQPGPVGTANPRLASNACISRTVVETVERSTKYSSVNVAWGS
ncbi:hypothetical protein [Streptomyces sp. NPDC001652]|uniref:hypothetical protein n=1 Tax=Streptomyces sp. NPDC001652 TaxID=3154393 RepID=UPI003332C8EF